MAGWVFCGGAISYIKGMLKKMEKNMLKKFAITILAICGFALAADTDHKVEIVDPEHGDVIVYKSTTVGGLIVSGSFVGLRAIPDRGYVLDTIWAVNASSDSSAIALTKDSTNHYSFNMPDGDVTASAAFKKGSYNVTVNGCTLLTCPAVSVHEFGSQVTITIKKSSALDGGFEMGLVGLASGDVSGDHQGEDYVYTFAMPGNDVTFNVTEKLTVKPTRFKITLNGCENLNCSAPDSANVGDEVTIRILSTESYWPSAEAIVGFGDDDIVSKKTTKDSSVYVITMPSNPVTVTVSPEKQQYQVRRATGATHGVIVLEGHSNGSANLDYGSEVKFTVTPDENYEIDFVKVVKDGDSTVTVKTTEKNGTYTYKVPGFNTVISAGFKAVATSSSSSSGPNSQGDGSSSSKKNDSSSSRTDNLNSSSSEDNGYYCVDIVKDDNGTIQMAGSFSREQKNCTLEGNEITLGAYPESGYTLESISVKKKNGDKVKLEQDGSTYKFKMPGSDVTVKATYKIAEYEVKVEGCGDLKCEVSQSKAKAGDEIMVTITLVAGYSGFSLSASGIGSLDRKDSGAKTSLKFTMPGNDVTITVEPQAKPGTVTSSSSSGEGDKGKSSSSSGKSGKNSSSSKGDKDAIHVSAQMPQFSVIAADRQILVSGVQAGTEYFLLDINGRVMSQGCSVAQDFTIAVPRSGNYLLRVGKSVRTVNVK